MLSEMPHAPHQGVVMCKYRGQYLVQENGRSVPCSISNMLRKQLIYPIADPNSLRQRVVDVQDINVVDPVAVGDQVAFTDAGDGSGHIIEVLPRRNELARLAPGSAIRRMQQVMVANVDQAVPMLAAAQPAPNWNLLDRYLVTAEAAGIPALICITKADLLRERERETLETRFALYRALGYTVLLTSAAAGTGIAALRAALQNRLSVFMGKSGVGKTSLLNAIEPELGLRVNAVREKDGRGRHTTTHLEAFALQQGGQVVDTPGMREFGLWGLDVHGLAACFPEMRPLLGTCRFGASCEHEAEPGCAIKAAVEHGAMDAQRYANYRKLAREIG